MKFRRADLLSRVAIGIAAIAAFIGGPALAATPAPRAAPVYTWTGFYIGGNVGYGWADPRVDSAGNATTFSFPQVTHALPNSIAFAGSHTAGLNGFVGGGQIGYNYQISPKWLLGLEADIQGSAQRGTNTFTDAFLATVCTGFAAGPVCAVTTPFNGTANTVYQAKIGWFGMVRGRLGALITDHILVYGTGGLAYGNVKVSGSTNVDGSRGLVAMSANDPKRAFDIRPK
jgi:outer membrane immunogenic protein